MIRSSAIRPSARFERMLATAEEQGDDIVSSSFENWPRVLAEFAFAAPSHSVACGLDVLHELLLLNANYARLHNEETRATVPVALGASMEALPSGNALFRSWDR